MLVVPILSNPPFVVEIGKGDRIGQEASHPGECERGVPIVDLSTAPTRVVVDGHFT
ncbi:hypothetical protein [Mesorhizobium sp. WSM4312]|uniref:hypothetical protein n=1 Tax=Mesorhizobium sp. WSM4312 TaxID=2029411 RepID=UPI0015C7E3C4|nr:hypothetical protein [Mesorhizobium sp. WSM4312]